MMGAGHGVFEVLIDQDEVDEEFDLLRRLVERSGRPLSLTVAQLLDSPDTWQTLVHKIDAAQADGLRIRGQLIGRPTGLLLGLNVSVNPFLLKPSYIALSQLTLDQRVAEVLNPDVRARIIDENPGSTYYKSAEFLQRFDQIFELGDPPNYVPAPDSSIAAIAARKGRYPREVAYDLILKRDGQTLLFLSRGNYAYGTIDPVLTMLKIQHMVLGLGDGGAHYGAICDAGYPTFMLTYWIRRKEGERLPLSTVVRELTGKPAQAVGLDDRGFIAPGYEADLNIIDYRRLHLHSPRGAFDLPAGGRRLPQDADGYVATIVSGTVTYREGEATGALPGRLVRAGGLRPTSTR